MALSHCFDKPLSQFPEHFEALEISQEIVLCLFVSVNKLTLIVLYLFVSVNELTLIVLYLFVSVNKLTLIYL